MVRLLTAWAGADFAFEAGDQIEDGDDADRLVAAGLAEPIVEEPKTTKK